MRYLSQHLVDLNRAPHFRAGIIASFWTKDYATAIDFHQEGYLWNQKGQKNIVCFGENGWWPSKEHRDLVLWQNPPMCLEFKHFCPFFALPELERPFQTIPFLTRSLKDCPQVLLACVSRSAFRQVEVVAFLSAGTLFLHSTQGSFLKVTSSIYLRRKESCLGIHTVYHSESKLCIYIVWRQVSLSESICSCEDNNCCVPHSVRGM